MNPYDAERLRDEVIYLHSLWHQGPPPPPQNPVIHQPYIPQHTWHLRPHPQPAPAHTRSLPTVPSTTFKKRKRNSPEENVARPDPGPAWPVPVRPDPTPAPSWAAPKPGPAPPPEAPLEGNERLLAMKAQQKACGAFKKFLSSYNDDDDDDDGDDYDDGDDGWEEFEEFFEGVFLEDHELRGYYQRSYESGEFCCMVCSAIGKKKAGKRFKDCVGLVQHSMSIMKTLKKQAHRGFGLAVCKVLGWDPDRLPTIVVKGKPLGMEMKPAQAEGESQVNNVVNDGDGKDGSQSLESDDKVVPLELGDKPIEEPAQECSSKEWGHDEKSLDTRVQNGDGGAIHEGEPEKPADCHIDDSNVLQENQAK
ncbi:uncharacterized protein LOC109818174 [Cajanus cajan]|uniref:uncharacterized protein LOC109818174 n=1 Tax=Cajanus cajan TaxID=3821 RepID=UPI00098DAB26|nr:uncharacterized protein LOC109818174 [Cajanus cajan]